MGNIVSGRESKCNENYPTERALGAVRDPGDSFSRFVLRGNPLSAGWHRARLVIRSARRTSRRAPSAPDDTARPMAGEMSGRSTAIEELPAIAWC
jgi:hypothetical protein